MPVSASPVKQEQIDSYFPPLIRVPEISGPPVPFILILGCILHMYMYVTSWHSHK